MAASSVDPLRMCPNCNERRADTQVDYYEVVSFNYSTGAATRRIRAVSWSKSWVSGKEWLCAQCAGVYNRSVERRRTGRRLINWGAAVLLGGGILFLILYANIAAARSGIGEFLIAVPTLLGLIGVIVGLVLLAMGMVLKRRGTHFLEKRLKG